MSIEDYVSYGERADGTEIEREVQRLMRDSLIQTAAADRIERIRGLGADTYDDQTVIRWRHSFADSATVYTYAAVKSAGRWHTTGATSKSLTWVELTMFVASSAGPAAIEVMVGTGTAA